MSSMCEPCKYSQKENIATYTCADCGERYCEKCSEEHVKFRAFRKHIVVKLEQQAATSETLDDSTEGHNSLYSGSDDLAIDKESIYAGSDAIEDDKNVIYAGSDDLETSKTTIYAGSDDLETSKTTIYAGSDDFSESQDVDLYSAVREDVQPVNHFYIDVGDTTLSRNIGIQGQKCLLIVSMETASISVSQQDEKKFESSLAYIRRFGKKSKDKTFTFEFGRKFLYGPGLFEFKTENGTELAARLREIMAAHSGKK